MLLTLSLYTRWKASNRPLVEVLWEAIIAEAVTDIASYRVELIRTARALYDRPYRSRVAGFVNGFSEVVRRGLGVAWQEGAATWGIEPKDFKDEEIEQRDDMIDAQVGYVPEFGEWILEYAGEKNWQEDPDRKGYFIRPPFDVIEARVELWMNNYNSVQTRAKLMTGMDRKMRWTLGATELHCAVCKKLDGKVKRGSYWLEHDILPQNPPNEVLDCGGWRCDCSLEPTDEEVTDGSLLGESEDAIINLEEYGTASSGNRGHVGVPGQRGGSVGTGKADERTEKIRAQNRAAQQRFQAKKKAEKAADLAAQTPEPEVAKVEPEPTPQGRTLTSQEASLSGELDAAMTAMDAATDENEKAAIGDYARSINSMLDDETLINDALYEQFGVTPDDATPKQWEDLATSLSNEGEALYKKYTKDGILMAVAEKRKAHDAGWAGVGGEFVRVKRGAFGRTTASQMAGTMWAGAKGELGEKYGTLLTDAGFDPKEIETATFEQRQKLCKELGEMRLATKGGGKPAVIDSVAPSARERVLKSINFDHAVTFEGAAKDPLNMPTVDAWRKMHAADVIHETRLGWNLEA